MSLKRKEWEDMWYEVKMLEKYLKFTLPHFSSLDKQKIAKNIRGIKDKIESVIGQME